MKSVITVLISLLGVLTSSAQKSNLWITRNAEISFFSTAPIEDIDAHSNQGVSALNAKSGEIYFKVLISTFQFKNSLMQDHFNEDFMESDKYPYAEFKGKVMDSIDLTKDGTYPVTVNGQFTLHNVTRDYTVKGSLHVGNGMVQANSKFDVKLADHNIKIPRLVMENVAEVVQVSVNARYSASPGS